MVSKKFLIITGVATITASVAAFNTKALNFTDLLNLKSYLAGRNRIIKLPQANQPISPQLKYLTKHLVYVFYKNHICFFLSVFKEKTITLHLYSICGGIKTLKHNVRATLQLAYHGCKTLTHTSKTRHVKRTQMVVTVRLMIRVFVTFSDW